MSFLSSADHAVAKVVPLTCHGHSRPVTHLSFSAAVADEQYYLISACKDNNPMLRDGVTGDWIGTFLGHKGAVWQSRLSQTGDLAATASADFTAKVWDPHTGECLHTLRHDHIVRAVAFAPGAQPTRLATAGFEKRLRLWDLAAGGGSAPTAATDGADPPPLPSEEVGAGVHGGAIKSVVWGPEPTALVTAADDRTLRWWDTRQREPVHTYKLDGPLGSCELTTANTSTEQQPNGSHDSTAHGAILAVAAGKTALFFAGARPGELLAAHTTPHELACVALHPGAAAAGTGAGADGAAERRFVAGGAGDTWVRVYDWADGAEVGVRKGHHGPVWSVAFAPDGRLYATGSEDGTVKLWKFGAEPYGLWR